jgi:hypothetical protein
MHSGPHVSWLGDDLVHGLGVIRQLELEFLGILGVYQFIGGTNLQRHEGRDMNRVWSVYE